MIACQQVIINFEAWKVVAIFRLFETPLEEERYLKVYRQLLRI